MSASPAHARRNYIGSSSSQFWGLSLPISQAYWGLRLPSLMWKKCEKSSSSQARLRLVSVLKGARSYPYSVPLFFQKLIIVQHQEKSDLPQLSDKADTDKKKGPGVVKSNDVKYLCLFLGTSAVIVTKIWEFLNDRSKFFVLNRTFKIVGQKCNRALGK